MRGRSHSLSIRRTVLSGLVLVSLASTLGAAVGWALSRIFPPKVTAEILFRPPPLPPGLEIEPPLERLRALLAELESLEIKKKEIPPDVELSATQGSRPGEVRVRTRFLLGRGSESQALATLASTIAERAELQRSRDLEAHSERISHHLEETLRRLDESDFPSRRAKRKQTEEDYRSAKTRRLVLEQKTRDQRSRRLGLEARLETLDGFSERFRSASPVGDDVNHPGLETEKRPIFESSPPRIEAPSDLRKKERVLEFLDRESASILVALAGLRTESEELEREKKDLDDRLKKLSEKIAEPASVEVMARARFRGESRILARLSEQTTLLEEVREAPQDRWSIVSSRRLHRSSASFGNSGRTSTLLGALLGAGFAVTLWFSLRRAPRRPPTEIALILGIGSLAFAADARSEPRTPTPPSGFLSGALAPRLDRAIHRGTRWALSLDVDPEELRKDYGLKGPKHLTEKLFLISRLYADEADPILRSLLRNQFRESLGETPRPPSTTLPLGDRVRFREDIMSWIHACSLARQMGIALEKQYAEIEALTPTILDDLPHRAVSLQMMFVRLLDELAVAGAPPLEKLLDQSILGTRPGIQHLGIIPTYYLTHEIFVLTDYGRTPLPSSLAPESRLYLGLALPHLAERSLRSKDADLLAELLLCLGFCGLEQRWRFEDGIRYLLSQQNPDGSFDRFGNRGVRRPSGPPSPQEVYGSRLHATQVVVWALLEARKRLHSKDDE